MTEEDWVLVHEVFDACRSRRGDKGRDDRKFLEALHYFTIHNITWRGARSRLPSRTAAAPAQPDANRGERAARPCAAGEGGEFAVRRPAQLVVILMHAGMVAVEPPPHRAQERIELAPHAFEKQRPHTRIERRGLPSSVMTSRP
jgi:hypothetical protein